MNNKNILITGAGGSIGAELSRQIKDLQPSKIILLDNSEYNLYNIHHELTITNGVEVIPLLSTVTNYKQIYNVIKQHQINTIIDIDLSQEFYVIHQRLLQRNQFAILATDIGCLDYKTAESDEV